MGYPKTDALLGVTREEREKNPNNLLERIKSSDVLGGFRFFNDHDPRVLSTCLDDPRCAKIVLTRNPVDSFVSWNIAQATGQWKLTNATHSKSHAITFDQVAFEAHLEVIQAFQFRIQRSLQITGQTAFYVGYDDLRDVDIINGLAQFLGIDGRLSNINKKLKKQNPESLEQKVSNFDEMKEALQRLDRFDLGRTPNFEPTRGPAIPTYIAAPKTGLLYMPLRSGPDAVIQKWLADLDGAKPTAAITKFSQKTLRDWQGTRVPHRSFAVLRHPLARAHAAFCDRILTDGPGSFPEIRANLRKVHKLPIPANAPDLANQSNYDDKDHKVAFLAFLKFLKNNLSGQTSIRVDPSWAGQLTLLQGMAQFALPDMVLREDRLAQDLTALAAQVGVTASPVLGDTNHNRDSWLVAIYDDSIEQAAREAYARDYSAFGFEDWA